MFLKFSCDGSIIRAVEKFDCGINKTAKELWKKSNKMGLSRKSMRSEMARQR
ncbi:hypothetical protein LEP1GSC051_1078 [Leptospira sp. P2653]|uniref:Uncharacterized protein n=1 Tax=Leptospira weilii str. UI 13098 TaxID=1088542 RepID=M6QD48_9LEPT|nr:hypothetical protein LEP1GSC051_1078 [Leptospira sp. P2653]EMN91145.1 hypothetical protein LEP1GSC108_1068 [Leptospira weilii str. UI 13098]